METLSNVWRLLLNCHEHIASFVVETLVRVVVADVLDSTTDDLLVVEMCLGSDLTEDHNHAGLGSRLASDLGQRIFGETCVQDGI
jgi:hypothetical protein